MEVTRGGACFRLHSPALRVLTGRAAANEVRYNLESAADPKLILLESGPGGKISRQMFLFRTPKPQSSGS